MTDREVGSSPRPEELTGADPCELSRRWLVREDVTHKVVRMANLYTAETGQTVRIISGYRSPEKQRQLARQGRPAASVDLSNHTSCPATAVDVSLGFAPTDVQKAILGRISRTVGLRWGGGSPINEKGIPSDWNHFDLGPRSLVST